MSDLTQKRRDEIANHLLWTASITAAGRGPGAMTHFMIVDLWDALAAAERARDAWKQVAEARAALNVAYRLGDQRRADRALSQLENAEAALRTLALERREEKP